MSVFQQRTGSPARSEAEDGGMGDRGQGSSAYDVGARSRVGGQSGFVEREAASTVLRGRGPVISTRKYKYDVTRGRGVKMDFNVTRDDRMSDTEAREALDKLHKIFGVLGEDDGFLHNFDQALFFCYTLNSGSVLNPGRAVFSVSGSQEFKYAVVRDSLGNNLRRFGRAFADDIRRVNQRVMDEFDPWDEDKADKYHMLQQVAQSRGTFRAMDLTHDSAICCKGLSPHEYALVTAAANMVITTNNNSADRMKNNDRVQSAEKYDSTTGDILGNIASLAGDVAKAI